MKRPHEDSSEESDIEVKKQSCVAAGSPEGGTSQEEEGNSPQCISVEAEREEEEHVEIGGDPEDVEGGEDERTPREVEEDLRFSENLADLKTRQEPRVVNSLENLALQCVSDNTDYFATKSEPFECLPGAVFRLLKDCLEKNEVITSKVLPLIISEKCLELCVSISNDSMPAPPAPWTPEEVTTILSLIEEKCKNTLTGLKLRIDLPRDVNIAGDGWFPKSVQINILLGSLKNLTELCIRSDYAITDDTLLVIALNCKQLRSLTLDDSRSITDTGVNYLCASAAPYGQCKNIEKLSLDNTSVSVDGIVTALSNLPKLTNLNINDALVPALEKFVKINGDSKQLQLKTLVSSYRRNLPLASAYFEKVCKVIPHVTDVSLEKLGNLGALLNIDAITDFAIQELDTSLPELNFFIRKFSSTLTRVLIFICFNDIDVSVFGICPNLKDLSLNCEIASINEFQLLPNSFMKLNEVDISQPHFNGRPNTVVDVSYVMQLVSSPTLSKIRLDFVTFPEASLYSLIVEAKEHQQIFSTLEEFYISRNEYSLETLMQLICVCPKLREFDGYQCLASDDESYLQLMKFAERNNLTNIEFLKFGESIGASEAGDVSDASEV